MSHNVLAFIIVWIVAVSFGIEYFNTAKNKFIIFLLVLFSLHSFVYGIFIFSSWGNYVSQRSSDWLIENPNAESKKRIAESYNKNKSQGERCTYRKVGSYVRKTCY